MTARGPSVIMVGLLVGCSSSQKPAAPNTAIVDRDASGTDARAASDAPAAICTGKQASPTVGQPCGCDEDCDPIDVCLTEGPTSMRLESGAPGGDCSRICDTTSDCPSGFDCITLTPGDPSTAGCLLRCSATANCRAGYVCQPAPGNYVTGAPTYCLPLCQSDADCPMTGVCDRYIGWCGVQPHPGSSGIGGPCQRDSDCISSKCLQIPGGYCSAYCSITRQGCPAGSTCAFPVVTGDDLGGCLASCTTSADCRVGYVCGPSPVNPSFLVCLPST